MQLTSIVALLVAATGAVASPGRAPPPPPPKPHRPAPPTIGPVTQTQSCGNSASAYCCNNVVDSKGLSYFECKSSTGSCNTIAICCQNNNNGEDGNAIQNCGLGNSQVIWL
ncbi:uncharacterized protein NECHADRAFT_106616 [Fusarium vanettenii 77-13-4]|uniref:Hydrophobin n=1 Tax=Fusarium vanettenii (strain ATCC MYA-4622 / CBS 123669 / FGSC 9596 / NRRL 45880 / 77-13-4) TaxID=660122 RepID=C7ZQZ4_FUSV7|nr:uncharacterized protein NECHADRAFT_106616 [Fusarium vanettenii 77-13-4]EEU33563.1 predicted protein [Fusarium vanettenii 77-13-4]